MDAGVNVDVSLQYSQRACALSGDDESLSKLRHLLASETGAVVTSLDVPVAYHSRHVDSCTQPLAHMLEGLASTPPGVPFVSSVTGAAVTTELGADYWVSCDVMQYTRNNLHFCELGLLVTCIEQKVSIILRFFHIHT